MTQIFFIFPSACYGFLHFSGSSIIEPRGWPNLLYRVCLNESALSNLPESALSTRHRVNLLYRLVAEWIWFGMRYRVSESPQSQWAGLSTQLIHLSQNSPSKCFRFRLLGVEQWRLKVYAECLLPYHHFNKLISTFYRFILCSNKSLCLNSIRDSHSSKEK